MKNGLDALYAAAEASMAEMQPMLDEGAAELTKMLDHLARQHGIEIAPCRRIFTRLPNGALVEIVGRRRWF